MRTDRVSWDDNFERVRRAIKEGIKRQNNALTEGKSEAYGCKIAKDDPWGAYLVHIQGRHGELMVADALGLPVCDPWGQKRGEPDVGTNIEVRSTDHEEGHLPIHPDQAERWWYVLVVGGFPVQRVVGFCTGYDGKQKKYLGTFDQPGRPPTYWVPQAVLRPLSFMPEDFVVPVPRLA